MSTTHKSVAKDLPLFDRRVHSRAPVRSVAYVALDEGNGGIILNISEGGMSVHSVVGMVDDHLSSMRLQLSDSRNWVEAPARIAWRSRSKKVVGLQFVDLPENTRSQIRDLLSRENAASAEHKQASAGRPGTNEVESELLSFRAARRAQDLPGPEAYSEFPSERTTAGKIESNIGVRAVQAPKSGTLVFGRTLGYGQHARIEESRVSRQKAAGGTRIKGSRIAIAGLAIFLATASLAIGWETGRGAFGRAFYKVSHLGWPAAFVGEKPPKIPASLIPAAPEIERVAQSQTVLPAAASLPSKAAEESVRPQTLPTAPPAVRKQPPVAYPWTPSAPVHARSTAGFPNDMEESAPSVITPVPGQIGPLGQEAVDIHPLAPPAQPAALNRSTLIYRVDPLYPAFAMENRIEGSVEMKITVGQDGFVRRIEPVSGKKVLLDAAMEAVRQWRYTPTVLDGKPIETEVDITLQFQLPPSEGR